MLRHYQLLNRGQSFGILLFPGSHKCQNRRYHSDLLVEFVAPARVISRKLLDDTLSVSHLAGSERLHLVDKMVNCDISWTAWRITCMLSRSGPTVRSSSTEYRRRCGWTCCTTHVFTDLFTSLPVMSALQRALTSDHTGTIRQSRLHQMRKVPGGETPVAVETKQGINLVKWTDNVVTVASTVNSSRPEEEVQRWSPWEKKRIEIASFS